ncbi:hypothetical protein ACVNPS_00650 [Candidatus Bipolaricaulota sp. J31]
MRFNIGILATLALGVLSLSAMGQPIGDDVQTAPVTVVGQVVALTQWGHNLYLYLDLNADGIGDLWVKVTQGTAVYDLEGEDQLSLAEIEVGDYLEITKYYWNERLRYCEAQQLRLCLCDGTCDECQQLRERCQNVGDLQQLKERIRACTSEPKHDRHQYQYGPNEDKPGNDKGNGNGGSSKGAGAKAGGKGEGKKGGK